MDNASKALLMAGAVLITVLVISLTMYIVSAIRSYSEGEAMATSSSQIEAFNRYFVYLAPSGSKIKGYEAYNVICKAYDLNKTFGDNIIQIWFRTPITHTKDIEDLLDAEAIFEHRSSEKGHYLNVLNDYTYTYTYGNDGRINEIRISEL